MNVVTTCGGGHGLIYVSDYNNDRIVVMDGYNYGMVAAITVGSKPTELSIDATESFLWVINEGDDSVMIVDLHYDVPIRVMEPCDPDDLVFFDEDNRIHDVLVAPNGKSGYVTYSGGEASNGGVLVQYNLEGFVEDFRYKIGNNV